MKRLILFLLIFFLTTPRAHAHQVPKDLWKGLIAEACEDGREGMYAVCCVVRNRLERNMTPGLCGMNRKDLDEFVKRQGVKYEKIAKDVVAQVFEKNGQDVTQGATHFENIKRYGDPKWIKDMRRTVKIKSHTFFKERK